MKNFPSSTEDFAKMTGSLQFKPPEGPGGPPVGFQIKMADIDWVKRKFLDVPYADQSPSQRLDIYLPEAGEGPFPLVVHIHGGGFGMGDKRDDHMDTYLKGLSLGYTAPPGGREHRGAGRSHYHHSVSRTPGGCHQRTVGKSIPRSGIFSEYSGGGHPLRPFEQGGDCRGIGSDGRNVKGSIGEST